MRYNPEYRFVIGLVDKRVEGIDYAAIPYDVIDVESIAIEQFDDLCMKYDVIELSTAVKPFYIKHFLKSKCYDNVIYLDPDILVYDRFSLLEKLLLQYNIVLTPHITTPIDDDFKQQEEDFLNTGLYNLGFIALRSARDTHQMVDWWSRRTHDKAFIRLHDGLFTDQLWINFVPLFYKSVLVLTDPGYNVAYWNLHERALSNRGGTWYVNERYPLVFYHFSGFDPTAPHILSKHQNRFTFVDRPELIELFETYTRTLLNNGYATYAKYPCVYSVMKAQTEHQNRLRRLRQMPLIKRAVRAITLLLARKTAEIADRLEPVDEG